MSSISDNKSELYHLRTNARLKHMVFQMNSNNFVSKHKFHFIKFTFYHITIDTINSRLKQRLPTHKKPEIITLFSDNESLHRYHFISEAHTELQH